MRWPAFASHYPRGVHSWIAPIGDEKREELAPPLFRDLEVIVRHSQGKQDLGGASAELVKYRLMAIAFSLGVYLELPESEILQLIALAEEGKGDIYRRRSGLTIATLREKMQSAQSDHS